MNTEKPQETEMTEVETKSDIQEIDETPVVKIEKEKKKKKKRKSSNDEEISKSSEEEPETGNEQD